MLKFFATSVLTCCGLVCGVCDACDCGHCNCGCPCGAASASAAAPAPATAQATDAQSYRTYSYQPGSSYQPTPTMPYRSYGNRAPAGGFHDAGWKIRGN